MNDRTEIEARFLKAAAAFLPACMSRKPPRLSKNAALFQYGLSRQNNREVTKIKPLYQQKSRDPHQVSLRACNKAAATVINQRRMFSKVVAALLHAHNEAWCGERLFC